jgi:hypothetical protein
MSENTSSQYKKMKTSGYKYIVLAFIISAGCIAVKAQTTPNDKNVTVEREFKPVIQDAGKINQTPQILEPNVTKLDARYSEFNLPLEPDNKIYPIPSAELERHRKRNEREGFFRFGMGNGINSLAELALPLISKDDILLDLKLNHLGNFSSKANTKTNVALSLDKYYKNTDIFGGLGFGHEYLKYYGDNFNYGTPGNDINKTNLNTLLATLGDSLYTEQDLYRITRTAQPFKLNDIAALPKSETFWRFNTYFGIKSLPHSSDVKYNAEVRFQSFDSKLGLTENIIDAIGGFSTITGKNRAGVDIDLKHLMYNKGSSISGFNFWDAYTVFTINPFYSIDRENFNVRLGVKSSFSFVYGKAFNPSPDVHAEWRVIPKLIALYVGANGDYKVNTLNSMFKENRYLYSDLRVQDTYTPVNFYAGLKLKPVNNFLIDGFINYKIIDNQYFFVNKEYKSNSVNTVDSVIFTNRFNVIYSGASLLKVGIRANYNIFNFMNFEILGAYNNWNLTSGELAWNKPKFEANMNADLKLTNNLSLAANVFVEGERYARFNDKTMRMKPIVDINLSAAYSYSNWFTVFTKINNLLNSKYEYYYGYEVQGLNAMAGVAFSW